MTAEEFIKQIPKHLTSPTQVLDYCIEVSPDLMVGAFYAIRPFYKFAPIDKGWTVAQWDGHYFVIPQTLGGEIEYVYDIMDMYAFCGHPLFIPPPIKTNDGQRD